MKNEQRFLFFYDETKYIRFFQSYNPSAPQESLRNYIEVFNVVGQKLQKIRVETDYRDTVYSATGTFMAYVLY